MPVFANVGARDAFAANGPVKSVYYKDWAVGCDNGYACEAVAMLPVNMPDNYRLSLVMHRPAAGNDGMKITISGVDSKSDRYRLFVDRKLVDTGPINVNDESINIVGKDALKVARALVYGRTAKLLDGGGVELGHISLSGSAAALRYMDARQGFARSRHGIAALGKRRARPKIAEIPVISARRISAKGPVPETADLVKLAESGLCAQERFMVTEDSAYSLNMENGTPMALAMISCGNGAYNFSSAVYIGTKNGAAGWEFAPAKMDYMTHAGHQTGNLTLLTNAHWDAKTQRLSAFAKGRGLGDCGHSAEYIWDGKQFRLIRAQEMPQCQGSMDWITNWRAKVEYKE